MARILYFDCFSGASGDMVLGALLDAGLPLAELRAALAGLPLDDVRLDATRVQRAGLGATRFEWNGPLEGPAEAGTQDGHPPEHGHGHDHGPHHHGHPDGERTGSGPGHPHEHHDGHVHRHRPAAGQADAGGPIHDHAGHHGHRSAADIVQLIGRAALPEAVRRRASELVWRLAEAEAEIHGVPVSAVHLHEVGALDSIVDIVGGTFAIAWFGADRIVASPLNTGSGSVRCAHGVYPVPAPATARLLAGVPSFAEGPPVELLTPTGALLVTGHATSYGPRPPMTIERIGYGAGRRDFADRPNVLRVFVGDDGNGEHERVAVVECEIDDMNPQWYGVVMDRAFGAGALDVYFVPVQMKKGRPGTLVTVIAPPARRDAVVGVLFRETTTLGVRYHEVAREVLARRFDTVQTEYGPVRIKVALQDGTASNASPEFDDCLSLATARGVPVKDVHAAAMAAWRASRP